MDERRRPPVSDATERGPLGEQKPFEGEVAGRRGALRGKDAELESIVSRTPLLLIRCSADRRFLFVNRACAEFLGRTPEQIIGQPVADVLGREAWAAIAPFVERVLRGEHVEFELEIPYEHPGPRFMHAIYTPDRDEHGEVVGWVASIADVTERKQARASLEAGERRLQSIFETVAVSLWEEDFSGVRSAIDALAAQGITDFARYFEEHPEFVTRAMGLVRVLDVNDATVRLFEAADKTELLGSLPKIFTTESMHVFQGELVALAEGRTYFESEALLHTVRGNPVYVFFTMVLPAHSEPCDRVLFSVFDLTGRKKAELALRDNEARLAAEAAALARLNELSSRLWSRRSLREGLDEMLAATIELLGADMGNVQILEPERGVLHIATQRGFNPDFLEFFREVSTEDDSACGRALRSGHRLVIEDVETDPPYSALRPTARAAGYRAVQSTPLIGRDGTPLGMLSTHFRSVHRPGEQDLRRLDLYVRQAADFIERCRADEALREADRRKDEFIATLAHELRNPLAPVRNAIQILRLKGPPTPELQWARDVIDRQMQQMTRLIDDLMDLSRITRNRLELRKEWVALAKVLQGAVETSRPLLDGSGHELDVVMPPQPVYLHADITRLAQVFSNLLNNAAKYSERGSRISLIAEREGSDAVVSVRDRGIGIPSEMLPHIFEMFTQVDPSLERAQGGLGVGLTLVKRLVEMHGGNVTAHSDGPGKGSTFVVSLPIPATDPTHAAPPSRDEEPGAIHKRRVLIVDDNNDAATSLAMMLSILGYETQTAYDGIAGLEAAEEFRPDVALLDIGMPRLNGFDVARRIRQQPWGADMVLIAVTGWGQVEDKQRAIEAGFDHHLVKPADPTTLTQLLASAPRADAAR